MSETHDSSHGHGGIAYERRDTSTRSILAASILGVVVVALILVGVTQLFQYTKEDLISQIQLQPASAQLRELHANEARALNSYGVVDADKGVYRIPIDRAMELVAKEDYERRSRMR